MADYVNINLGNSKERREIFLGIYRWNESFSIENAIDSEEHSKIAELESNN